MSDVNKALTKIGKIDCAIARLEQTIVEKRRERQTLLDAVENAVRALSGRAPKGSYNGGQRGVPKGTPNLLHRKLTPAQVRELRAAWEGGAKQSELSARYGLPQPTISNIVHRKSYQDVT